MSTTLDLVCRTCREKLWVGQRNYIYTTADALKALEQFLFKHRSSEYQEPGHTHHLEFVNEHDDSTFEYVEFKPEVG